VPLNATARRALRQLLEQEPTAPPEAAVFRSGRNAAMPIRSMQNAIAALVRRASLARSDITAHSLRHTFALAWLRQHPGQLIELSQLLGHVSLDTTAVYTRASAADLARTNTPQSRRLTCWMQRGTRSISTCCCVTGR
jgi:integrase